LRAYLSINGSYGAARADFFRYLLIFHFGGVWLDAKSTSTKPLSNLIQADDELLLSHWSDPTTGSANELFWGERSRIPIYEFQNWWLIARPRHPSFEKLIVDICKNIATYSAIRHGVGRMGVLGTTGPLAFTRSIYPTLTNRNHRIIEAEDEGLVYTIFDQTFAHRSVIGTNYQKVKAPLISSGWRGSLEALLADSFMTFKRVIRKLRMSTASFR
jgi:hypothetical protein